MKAFIVVQSAVYRHDVGPVAATLEKAIELGCARAKLEKDSHHVFEVLEVSDSLGDGKLAATITNVFPQVARWVGLPSHEFLKNFDTGTPEQKVEIETAYLG